jgi:hypothetical protein
VAGLVVCLAVWFGLVWLVGSMLHCLLVLA